MRCLEQIAGEAFGGFGIPLGAEHKGQGIAFRIDGAVEILLHTLDFDIHSRNNVAKISLDFSATISRKQIQLVLEQLGSSLASTPAERCHGEPSQISPSDSG